MIGSQWDIARSSAVRKDIVNSYIEVNFVKLIIYKQIICGHNQRSDVKWNVGYKVCSSRHKYCSTTPSEHSCSPV